MLHGDQICKYVNVEPVTFLLKSLRRAIYMQILSAWIVSLLKTSAIVINFLTVQGRAAQRRLCYWTDVCVNGSGIPLPATKQGVN